MLELTGIGFIGYVSVLFAVSFAISKGHPVGILLRVETD